MLKTTKTLLVIIALVITCPLRANEAITPDISCSDKALNAFWENQLTYYVRPNFGPTIKQDYRQARQNFFKSASQGNARSQFVLGYIYDMGIGSLPTDKKTTPEDTYKWFQKSAQQGNEAGQFGLAGLYYFGKGVNKDYSKAIAEFEKLPDVIQAQFILATIYSSDQDGIPRDLTKAKSLFEKLALRGEATAQLKLADMYLAGEGTERNPLKAKEWYEKAAEQHLVEAQLALWQMYLSGKDMPKDEVKAQEWFDKALGQDVGMAQLAQGKHYYLGINVSKDLTKAQEWFEKAARQNNAEAQYLLGQMYYEGTGVKQDLHKAQEWFKKSAISNDEEATYYTQQMQEERERDPDALKAQAYYKLQTTCTLNTLIVPKLLELRQRLNTPKTTPK